MEMEECRQIARKLESELSAKLGQYSKMSSLQNLERAKEIPNLYDNINSLENDINDVVLKVYFL